MATRKTTSKTAGKTAAAKPGAAAPKAEGKPAAAAAKRSVPAAAGTARAPASKPATAAPRPATAAPSRNQPAAEAPTGEARYRWIAYAAYLRAEKRGFAPGQEVADWLAAEADFRAAFGGS